MSVSSASFSLKVNSDIFFVLLFTTKPSHSRFKVDILYLHHYLDYISAAIARETLPQVLLMIH